jgi:hypothetical protein
VLERVSKKRRTRGSEASSWPIVQTIKRYSYKPHTIPPHLDPSWRSSMLSIVPDDFRSWCISNMAESPSLLQTFIRGTHCWRHNEIIPNLPIDGRCDTFLIRSLQRINDSQHLRRIPPTARGIHHRQSDFLCWVDNEHRADGEGNFFLMDVLQVLGVQHIVQEGNLSVGICDYWKLEAVI